MTSYTKTANSANVVAMIQARFSSSRLPGKVLKPMQGIPMLQHVVNRVQACQYIDKAVVLTSDQTSDDPLAKFCQQQNIEVFRGPLNDVLGRYWLAAQHYQPQHIVRITADCPLLDPTIIDAVIEMHLQQNNDYTANCLQYTLPDGLDCEVFSFDTLKALAYQADKQSWREHVTLMLRQNKLHGVLKVESWQHQQDLSRWRLTVDYPQDFDFVAAIYQQFGDQYLFGLADIVELFKRDVALFNTMPVVAINEGIKQSKQHDKQLQVDNNGTVSEIG